MPTERFSNDANTTLNGAITNAATTLVVTSAAKFPTISATEVAQFRIRVEDTPGSGTNLEYMTVTLTAGTTFTVARGQEGTAGIAHASGSSVTLVISAGALGAVMNSFNFTGMISGEHTLPAAGQMGSTTRQNGELDFAPFWVPRAITADAIGVPVVAPLGSAGAVIRLGIYTDHPTTPGKPYALLLDAGTIDATVSGLATIAISQALSPGLIWLACATQGSPSTLPGVRISVYAGFQTPFFAASPTVSSGLWYVAGGVVGALPATVTPGRWSGYPMMTLRAA